MAIDYKKEWEKLQRECGHLTIIKNGCVTLGYVMDNQIKKTISKREGLMKEFIKENIKTDIAGGGKGFHLVDVIYKEAFRDRIRIRKQDFATWCEKKGGK